MIFGSVCSGIEAASVAWIGQRIQMADRLVVSRFEEVHD